MLGAYVVYETVSGKQHNLYRIRNPWGIMESASFLGSWAYNASNWNLINIETYNLPYTPTVDDGVFWMEDFEFVQAYDDIGIGYF
jgi:hypothetical protein